MNKAMGLVVAAAVLMMSAMTVMFMASDGLGDVGEQTEDIDDRNCEFQFEHASEVEDVDPDCRDQIDSSAVDGFENLVDENEDTLFG